MILNLWEFLVYLEDKKIINPSSFESPAEVQNLIQDILWLDLNKFKPNKTEKKSSAPSTAFKKRGGSQSIPGEEVQMEVKEMSKRRASEYKEEGKWGSGKESPAVSSWIPKPSLERKKSGNLSSSRLKE